MLGSSTLANLNRTDCPMATAILDSALPVLFRLVHFTYSVPLLLLIWTVPLILDAQTLANALLGWSSAGSLAAERELGVEVTLLGHRLLSVI